MTTFKVGDRVRITDDAYTTAGVRKGDTGTVEELPLFDHPKYQIYEVRPDIDVDGDTWPFEPNELEKE